MVAFNYERILPLQFGIYSFSAWSVIGVLPSLTTAGIVSGIGAILSLVEATVQTIFIFDASKRVRVEWKTAENPTSASSSSAFTWASSTSLAMLILLNIAFWVINVFRTLQSHKHPLEMAYYGQLGWTIIVHLTVPAMTLYRFHATVMLFDIWLNMNRSFVLV